MDILIKGMELPKELGLFLLIGCDGTVEQEVSKLGSFPVYNIVEGVKAIELPSHARLKDESVIIQNMEDAFCKLFPIDGTHKQVLVSECHKAFLKAVFDAPTVLEASNE